MGDARSIAPTLAEDGIGVDIVPVQLESRAEVAVDKIVLPPDIRRGQPVNATVVLTNYSPQPITGKLKVTRRIGPNETLLSEEAVELRPGKNVRWLPEKIEQSAVYTYQADFFPDDPRDDLMVQNNRATAFTHVRGKGTVLLIEDWQHPDEFVRLVERLRENNIEVTVMGSNRLFTSLAELQAFDCVILGNVPRSSGDDVNGVTGFSDEQIAMLVRNTEQMGAGLVMLGGPNSFGVGGWSNTELEKAMPVDFQIKNAKIRAVGALAMIMHASEIPEGNFWQKKIAEQAINALGPMDYCGVLQFDGGATTWLWKEPIGITQVGEQRTMMLTRVGRMVPQDMPDFDPGMQKAFTGFSRINQASVSVPPQRNPVGQIQAGRHPDHDGGGRRARSRGTCDLEEHRQCDGGPLLPGQRSAGIAENLPGGNSTCRSPAHSRKRGGNRRGQGQFDARDLAGDRRSDSQDHRPGHDHDQGESARRSGAVVAGTG
jgi:hypothetical protein